VLNLCSLLLGHSSNRSWELGCFLHRLVLTLVRSTFPKSPPAGEIVCGALTRCPYLILPFINTPNKHFLRSVNTFTSFSKQTSNQLAIPPNIQWCPSQLEAPHHQPPDFLSSSISVCLPTGNDVGLFTPTFNQCESKTIFLFRWATISSFSYGSDPSSTKPVLSDPLS